MDVAGNVAIAENLSVVDNVSAGSLTVTGNVSETVAYQWTSRLSPELGWRSVTYGGGLYVAVSNNMYLDNVKKSLFPFAFDGVAPMFYLRRSSIDLRTNPARDVVGV